MRKRPDFTPSVGREGTGIKGVGRRQTEVNMSSGRETAGLVGLYMIFIEVNSEICDQEEVTW